MRSSLIWSKRGCAAYAVIVLGGLLVLLQWRLKQGFNVLSILPSSIIYFSLMLHEKMICKFVFCEQVLVGKWSGCEGGKEKTVFSPTPLHEGYTLWKQWKVRFHLAGLQASKINRVLSLTVDSRFKDFVGTTLLKLRLSAPLPSGTGWLGTPEIRICWSKQIDLKIKNSVGKTV